MEDPKEKESLIRRLVIFFTVIYAIQGLSQSGISGMFYLPMSFILKDRMGFDQQQLAYFMGLVMIPWTMKPLYGVLSDFVPIFGYRRRSWFIVAAGLGMSAALYLAITGTFAYNHLLVLLMITALGIAFCDVLCDAVMVENGKKLDKLDKFQGVQWRAIYTTSIAAGIIGGFIAKHLTGQVFWLMTIPPALIFLSAIFFVPEKRHQYKESKTKSEIKSVAKSKDFTFAIFGCAVLVTLLAILNNKWFGVSPIDLFVLSTPFLLLGSLLFVFRKVISGKIIVFMIFIFWWDFALYLSSSPFLYYKIDTLGFSKMFLGTLQACGTAAAAIGAWVFMKISRKKIVWGNQLLTNLTLDKMLFFALCIGMATILTNFLLMGPKSAIALSIGTTLVFVLANLTILVTAGYFCPEKIEGTFFALLMSVINLGASMSERASGYLFKLFYNMAPQNYADNFWAQFLIWLGWPDKHANPETTFNIFAQYYSIGWLIVISLSTFAIYFLIFPKFRKLIENVGQKEKPETLDIQTLFKRKNQ